MARNLGYISDPRKEIHIGATADVLTIDVRPLSLWSESPWIERIRIDGLDMVLAAYANSPPNTEAPSYPFIDALPRMHVGALQVRDSKFAYALDPEAQRNVPTNPNIPDSVSVAEALKLKKHHAFLPFHTVNADFGPVGTRRDLSPDFVTATATASQSETARVRVDVRMGVFENTKIDDVEIWAKTAQLSKVNTMFTPAEGIKLSGYLHEGHAMLEVRKRKLKATVSLVYDGFDMHYVDGYPGRSGLKTLVSNMVSGVSVDEVKKANNSEGKASATVHLEQLPFDNVFSFLVAGIHDAVDIVVRSK